MALTWKREDKGTLPRFAFAGRFDADANLDGLSLPFPLTVLDFESVTHVDRAGVRKLLALVQRLKIDQSLEARRCPPVLIDQLSRSPALAMRLVVRSLMATMECRGCGKTRPALIRLPDGPSAATARPCSTCGGKFAPTSESARLMSWLVDPDATDAAQRERERKESAPPVKRAKRHVVHLEVAYGSAQEFVAEYAQNLSNGGMFISGANKLTMGDEVSVTLAIPGYDSFELRARVAHLLSDEDAVPLGRRGGAGVEVIDPPAGYTDALQGYLARLGRRRDAVILSTSRLCRDKLEDAGYLTQAIKTPDELMPMMAHADKPIVGIVVTRREDELFMAAAQAYGVDDLVCAVDYIEELDALLADFDDRLPL